MSTNAQKTPFQLQLEELVRLGIGGKFNNKDNHIKVIQEELEHEEAMLRGGLDRFRKAINNAKAKNQESTTLYGLVLQQKYINELSNLINDSVIKMTSGIAGRNQIAMKLICQCLPHTAFDKGAFISKKPNVWDTCSLIVLKNCIDGISDEITLNKLSMQVAKGLMMEAKIIKFKEQHKDNYLKTQRKLAGKNLPQKMSRYKYKSKVWTYMMNRLGLDFDNWTNVQMLHLGIKMIGYVEQLGLIRHQNRKTAKNKTVTFVEATPKIIQEIKDFNIRNELLFPKYLPMVAPPRDWTSPFTGGYYGKKFNSNNNAEEIERALQLHKTNQ